MVDRERELVAVGGEPRARRHLEPGVADERAEAACPACDLPGERAHRRRRAEVEPISEAAPAPLSPAIRRTASADARRSRLAMTTCQPARASSRAHSKPMPELPPVMRTTSRFIAAPVAVRPSENLALEGRLANAASPLFAEIAPVRVASRLRSNGATDCNALPTPVLPFEALLAWRASSIGQSAKVDLRLRVAHHRGARLPLRATVDLTAGWLNARRCPLLILAGSGSDPCQPRTCGSPHCSTPLLRSTHRNMRGHSGRHSTRRPRPEVRWSSERISHLHCNTHPRSHI